MIHLAVVTGIDPDRWAELGEQAIVTAEDIINRTNAAAARAAAPEPSSGREAPAGWESQ